MLTNIKVGKVIPRFLAKLALLGIFAINFSGNGVISEEIQSTQNAGSKISFEGIAQFRLMNITEELIPENVLLNVPSKDRDELKAAIARLLIGLGGGTPEVTYSMNGKWRAVKRLLRPDVDASIYMTSIVDDAGRELWTVETEMSVYLSNDGHTVVTGNPNFDFGVRIYNYPATNPVATISGGLGEVMFSDDGKYFLMNGTLLTSRGEVVSSGGYKTMSPDARFLLRGGPPPANNEPLHEDNEQEGETLSEPQRIESTGGVEEVEDSLGNVLLRNAVRVKTAEPIDIVQLPSGSYPRFYTLFNRDGSVAATGSVVSKYNTYFSKLRLSKPSGKFFALATYHNDLFVFESETGKQLWKYAKALVYNSIAALDIVEKDKNDALVLIGFYGTPGSPRDGQSWLELLNRNGVQVGEINLGEVGFVNALISEEVNFIVSNVVKDGSEISIFKIRR